MNITLRMKWQQWSQWEYWPLEVIYYPLLPVWLYFSLKARSLFFFSAANPGIRNGGMAMESKKEIYELLPETCYPKTLLIPLDISLNEILNRIQDLDITFPFVAKPDMGMKAFGVEKIKDVEQLKRYLQKIPSDFLIQELVSYPREIGVFYVRQPGEKHGRITGIVEKEFLAVIGDGRSTIEELVRKDPRSYRQLEQLRKIWGESMEEVLESGQKLVLVPLGSHTKGARFTDARHRISANLQKTIDGLCSSIPGFYYGRLDILFRSYEELEAGMHFSVIEVNGAGSEATHIYDPRHSLLFAWKEIIRHWKLLYNISSANKRKGHQYLSFREGIDMLRQNSQLEASLKPL